VQGPEFKFLYCKKEGRREGGRKEGKKKGRKEGRKKRRKDRNAQEKGHFSPPLWYVIRFEICAHHLGDTCFSLQKE
jgi:hypothetical protein